MGRPSPPPSWTACASSIWQEGELTAVLKMMGKLSAEERPAMGQLANEVRAALESAIEEQGKRLEAKPWRRAWRPRRWM